MRNQIQASKWGPTQYSAQKSIKETSTNFENLNLSSELCFDGLADFLSLIWGHTVHTYQVYAKLAVIYIIQLQRSVNCLCKI